MVNKAFYLMSEFYKTFNVNQKLLTLITEYPEIVNPEAEIYGFFGMFPGCIWNGGRVINNTKIDINIIRHMFFIYNVQLNKPLRLTFTNPCITEDFLDDEYSNIIASLGNNGKNEILVANPILENYLRTNYSEYKYVKSVVAANGLNDIQQDYNSYDMIVLNKRYNNNFNLLDVIDKKYYDKIELICNDTCIKDACPYQKQHYYYNGMQTLYHNVDLSKIDCQFGKDEKFWYHAINQNKEYISPEAVRNLYLPRGFKYFKLVGREQINRTYMNWLKYIIKPEYWEDVLNIILNIATNE